MKQSHFEISFLLSCFATTVFLFFPLSSASAMTIVLDHSPNAVIVVDSHADNQVQAAAKTLQAYIAKSTGATLPLGSAPGNGINIHVGETDFTRAHHLNPGDLDQDGFILQGVDDKNFAIIGGSDWGVEFGVDDFLERYLGVHWLMPTGIGEDVPRHATVDIPPAQVRQEPVYLSRQLSPMNDLEADDPAAHWARFNRARGRILFHHNMLNLFPVSKFGEAHPEFYPMIGGKRYIPKDDADYLWQPNFSAPGMVDAAAGQIETYFQENPTAASYSLGMNDSNNWDESDASKARRSGRKNYLGLEDTSDDYFTWANAVATKVLLQYPDKWFGTLAYQAIAEPPTKVNVNPRIVPFITYDRMRWEDPKLRETGRQLTESWEKVSPVLGWYDYAYGSSYLLPRVYFHRMQNYLSWGAAHHVKFSYTELYPNWGEGPKAWVLARLLWNPNQDVDALLDDWYLHFAGDKAAPKLKDFYAVWEKFWTVDIYKSKWYRSDGLLLPFNTDPGYLLDVPESYISQSDADMQAALQLADTPQRKARVAELKKMWDFYKASILVYQAVDSVARANPQSEAQALDVLDKTVNVMEQARRRQELLAALKQDPLYSSSAGNISQFPPTAGKNWGASLLWNILPWAQNSAPVRLCLQQLAQSSDILVQQQANQILQTVNGKPALVLANASFEDGIKNWVTWDKSNELPAFHKGIWTVSTGVVHSGTHSLVIQGLGRGALMQNFPYVPGNYFARAYCYVPKDSKVGVASLELQILNSKGQPRGGNFRLPSINIPLTPGGWSSVTLPFTLPPDGKNDAASVRLQVVLNGFDPDGEIVLDDVGAYRVQ